jgi:hypothetical protein
MKGFTALGGLLFIWLIIAEIETKIPFINGNPWALLTVKYADIVLLGIVYLVVLGYLHGKNIIGWTAIIGGIAIYLWVIG